MKIVENGLALFDILVPKNADDCVRFASKELRDFIKKCTGTILDIINDADKSGRAFISIGNTDEYKKLDYSFDFETLNGDGFFIKSLGNNIYINAACDRGVLFGVYDFLERFLGIRFIAKDTTVLPKTSTLEIGEPDIVSVPAFRMRGYLEASMMRQYADLDFALRKRAHHSFLEPDLKHGGRPAMWGRNVCHNFHFYVPMETYLNPDRPETYHPEFYYGAGINGVDETDGFIAHLQPTVCLTNGITEDGRLDESMELSVAKIVIEEMKKDVIANPDITFFVLDQEDGPVYCKCDKCMEAEKKYKRSGILIRFCNVIAKALQDWADRELNGRKIYIVTFAYSYSAEPPVTEKDGIYLPLDRSVQACDNLVMRMCVCSTKMYDCFDERQPEHIKKMLNGWKVLCKRFFVWTYDAFFDRYLLFFPSLERIVPTIKGFKEYGAEYIMVNGAYNSDGLWQDIMKAYIWQAMLWNPELNQGELTDEFLYYYFGDIGSKYVKRFIEIMYDFYRKECETKDIFFHSFGMKDKNAFPKELLLDTYALIEKSREDVKEKEKDSEKVKLYDKHLAQVQLSPMFSLTEHYTHYFPDNTKQDYLKFAKSFVALCEYAGVTRYHEQLTIKSFVDANYVFPY